MQSPMPRIGYNSDATWKRVRELLDKFLSVVLLVIESSHHNPA